MATPDDLFSPLPLPPTSLAGEFGALLVLSCHIEDRTNEAWVCWNASEVMPTAVIAVETQSFHFQLRVELSLIEQLTAPGWQEHPKAPLAGERLPLSPAMRVALESLRRCPFSGPSRDLFHGARRTDLLLGFAELLRQRLEAARPSANRSLEARVTEAAEILGRELENPPSVELLARRVGLSESSLKRGFRDYQGDTVFGLLRKLRMRRARELLESGEATVMEASLRVGYSNPSNFAAAFRDEFGVNPKRFQLALRSALQDPGQAVAASREK